MLCPASADDGGAQPSRRARLHAKLSAERASLESLHLTAAQLRVELDSLRTEILNYEEAIAQARREKDNAIRERREVELTFASVRDEFDLQYGKLMAARREMEEADLELRRRLNEGSSENADLTERLNQLRQLEDEFNKKEATIEQLMISSRQMERQIVLYDAIKGKKQQTTPSSAAAGGAAAGTAAAVSPSSPSTAALTSLLTNPPAATSPSSASSPTPASASSSPPPELISPEVFDAVKTFVGQLAAAERQVRRLEEETRVQKVRIMDSHRSLQNLVMQLERSTAVTAELNAAVKSMESQYLEEKVKTEHALKTVHLLQKQKMDQQTLLLGYEERMKHFQQLLTAADVRADSANLFLSDLLRQWHVLKHGNRQLSEVVRRMRAEYRKLRKERNDAFAELHDKAAKQRGGDSSTLQTPSASAAAAASPSSLSDSSDWWGEKDRKAESHYRDVMAENSRLHAEVDELRERAEAQQRRLDGQVDRGQHDYDLNELHNEIDSARRFVHMLQQRVKQQEETIKAEGEVRHMAEKELLRMQREQEEAATAAAAAAAAAASQRSQQSSSSSSSSGGGGGRQYEGAMAEAQKQLEASDEQRKPKKADAAAAAAAAAAEQKTDAAAASAEDGSAAPKAAANGSEEERQSKKRKLDNVAAGDEAAGVAKVKEEPGLKEEKSSDSSAASASAEEAKEGEKAEAAAAKQGSQQAVADDSVMQDTAAADSTA